jgi:hypothetical protein
MGLPLLEESKWLGFGRISFDSKGSKVYRPLKIYRKRKAVGFEVFTAMRMMVMSICGLHPCR